MSHQIEITGQCKGCGSETVGPYCHECGQVANPQVPRVDTLLREFFADIANLDGRLLRSLRLLATNPGRLSRAFLRGERSPYLSPIQLLLLGGIPALLVAARVPRRWWGSLYDFTLQVPGDILGEWAAWGLLVLAAPTMALVLAVLFLRSGLRVAEHLVVSLHFFSAILVLATLQTGLVPVAQRLPWGVPILEVLGAAWALVLGFRTLRAVYASSRWGAAWRIVALVVLYILGYMWAGSAFS